ncbi:class I SAM-dependent methyltransferase [bacterium]|nr:class I SAM-dependent methyltransferase [bacterium]
MKSTKEFFDSYADKWDKVNIYKEPPESFRAIISCLCINSNSHVIDLGCGTGVFIPYLLEVIGDKGKIYAIDPSEKMIEQFKEKFNSTNIIPIVGSAEDLNCISDKIDAVLCFSAFPHFHNQEKTIAEIARVLKSKGRLVIAHFSSREEINTFHASLEPPICNHYLPSGEELAEVLQKHGMTIVHYENEPNRCTLVAKKNYG